MEGKTYNSAMANNYNWSILPFKPSDQWLKKMLIKFEDSARTDGRGNYYIDGDTLINEDSPDKLFHKFVIKIVLTAQTKAGNVAFSGKTIFDVLAEKNLSL